jgi:hypothetical protein
VVVTTWDERVIRITSFYSNLVSVPVKRLLHLVESIVRSTVELHLVTSNLYVGALLSKLQIGLNEDLLG